MVNFVIVVPASTSHHISDHHPKVYVMLLINYYRALHYSAKRGLAIACRLSVRLSVCDIGK